MVNGYLNIRITKLRYYCRIRT
ncbi:MAG: hypothetical protein RLZZ113_1272, partial [Pseudomonadota bacterium]